MFQWQTAAAIDRMTWLGLRLQAQQVRLTTAERYLTGTQPTAFVSADVAEQLQKRVLRLNVNYCKLLTDTLTQRVRLVGFKLDGADTPDAGLWDTWRANQLDAEVLWLLRDVFGLGRGYLLAWVGEDGTPAVTVESPFQCEVYRDPITRQVLGAVKQWGSFDDATGTYESWSVLYLPDQVLTYGSQSPVTQNSIPANGWTLLDSQPNPLGVVPLVEFANRTNVLDHHGTPEFESIRDLQDGLNKIVLDSIVTSEFGAFSRRWVTGLVIHEGENGEPVNPFGQSPSDVWTAENPDATFGQFDAQSLAGYDTEAGLLTRHIAAISGLPEYLTGTGASNPTSADQMRAADATLSSKAQQKIDLLTPPFALVAKLIVALQTGRPVSGIRVDPVFADLENYNATLQADAFSKQVAAGIPANVAAHKTLGWTPDEAAVLTNGTSND